MGGRVALHALVSASARFRGAILIGASPGIENETERVARLDADRQLAAQIRDCGIEWFVDCWESLPIFASQRRLPVKIATALHAQRLANEPEGLAYALENWSPGAQEWLLPRLDRIQASVCLMAGALDREYVESNRSMRSAMNQTTAECIEIPDAGHAPQIEQPLALAEAIIRFKQKTRIDE